MGTSNGKISVGGAMHLRESSELPAQRKEGERRPRKGPPQRTGVEGRKGLKGGNQKRLIQES